MPPLHQSHILQTPVLQFKSVFLIVLLTLACRLDASTLFVGDDPIPPAVSVVESQTNVLLTELSNRKLEFAEQPAKLVHFAKTIALKHWDITKASRLILGPHWRTASSTERQQFEDEFLRTLLRYVVRAYGYYDDELIKVVEYDWQETRRGGWVLSKVEIPGGVKVNVDYRMTYNSKTQQWSLIDVRVEGISLVVVKRQEFREIVTREGLTNLIAVMSNKNNEILKGIEEYMAVNATGGSK